MHVRLWVVESFKMTLVLKARVAAIDPFCS